ncbi:MAG TPA: DUF4440 domain-containing protein [Acetivibrio sp.]|mgnify:FL=1|jgi:hypothetical protein|nr:DUF4440 domain-containing protein [Clostridium sp.]HOQ02098.1 DUF4440 domain-containing protein [Acetivibrio clariflavus]HQA57522.1 DUF4440 domain-containing protein [Acetivibrio sp.]
MEKTILEKHIFDLEQSLLQPEVRQSSEKIAELLSDDFCEFCSSGNIYLYNKGDIFDTDRNLSVIDWKIKDFSIRILANDVVLATYKAIKYNREQKKMVSSLRSSIWKCFDGNWKMVFHQGTPTE